MLEFLGELLFDFLPWRVQLGCLGVAVLLGILLYLVLK
jgi:hypothetical protein